MKTSTMTAKQIRKSVAVGTALAAAHCDALVDNASSQDHVALADVTAEIQKLTTALSAVEYGTRWRALNKQLCGLLNAADAIAARIENGIVLVDVDACRNLLAAAQSEFAKNPSATAWTATEAAMYAYQQATQYSRNRARGVVCDDDRKTAEDCICKAVRYVGDLLAARALDAAVRS